MAQAAQRPTGPVTGRLVEFTVDTEYETFNPEVREDARKCLLDTIGVALAGAAEPGTRMLVSASGASTTTGPASVLGTPHGSSPGLAALVNGHTAHTLDYDDTQHRVGTHLSAPVVAAALAAAEAERRSGRDLLAAFVIGFEVGSRLGRSHRFARDQLDLGVYPTGYLGHVAAAAAASRLLGLDHVATNRALGLAAGQASGLVRSFGTMCKGFVAGNAAYDAVLSALLVQAGFTGPEDIIDGKGNMLAVYGGEVDEELITANLGEEYEITFNTLKQFACAGWRNPIIEAAIALTQQHPVSPAQIRSVEVWAWEGVSGFPNYPTPRVGYEGKFSAQHAAAVGLVDRDGGVSQFSDERVNDPVVAAVTRKTTLHFDPSFTHYEIRLVVALDDGRRLEQFIPVQKGDHANPLSWDELLQKFHANAARVLPKANIEPLAEALQTIDTCQDVTEIGRLCRSVS